jgi:RNA polymerase sigma-70 factor (family 1)
MTTFALNIGNTMTEQSTTIISQAIFEKLFKEYYDGLFSYSASLLNYSDGADDIVQSVFHDLWKDRYKIDIHTSAKSYLYRAVYNQCMNKHKHQKVARSYQSSLSTEESGYEVNDLEYQEIQTKIRDAVDGLPEQCQKIYRMSRYEDMKYQEIADTLKLSIKTIENQMGRALKTLRNALTDYLKIILITITSILS